MEFLHLRIEEHARREPDREAVVEGALRLSYAGLQQRILDRAAELVALGVEPGDRVAALSANRLELLELFGACARQGAVFVPLNTRLSGPELDRLLSDAQPRLFYLEEGWSGPLPARSGERVVLTACLPRPQVPAARVAPEAPLAILYTGGTTGTPKGAVITHATVYWNARNTVEGWGLTREDRAPIFTPMFHTGGLNVLTTPLLFLGATLILPGPFEPEAALRLLEQEACTLLFLVPTMFTMLAETPGFSPLRLVSVRQMISGGAPCPQALFERYWSLGLPLRQGYGLSEAGPNNFGVTLEEAQAFAGTVGRPLPHVKTRLLDEAGLPVAPGQVGELWLRGGHVMPGYWQRSQESRAVLQDGWLRTGDLARRDARGLYYIVGRSKEMFISGGENVFPAEVEEVLLSHPEVAEAAVVGVPHPLWGEVGRAYLVRRPTSRVSDAEVLEFCRCRLARYKTPKEVVFLSELPKGAAGKIQKRQLLEVCHA